MKRARANVQILSFRLNSGKLFVSPHHNLSRASVVLDVIAPMQYMTQKNKHFSATADLGEIGFTSS